MHSRRFLIMACCVALAMGGGGCRGHRSTETRSRFKVVLLGVDAATWAVITPLVERGMLPHFRRLREEGATGVLQAREPLWSPAIWTSIATGVVRERHGITDFVTTVRDGRRVPFTSNQRRRLALWNILSGAGRTVGVVNWWVTYPAEQVNGFMVSNYWRYFYHRLLVGGESEAELLSGLADAVYPSGLSAEIGAAASVSSPEPIDWNALERHEVDGAVDPGFGLEFARDEAIFRRILERDAMVRVVAERLYRERSPDFFGVYFEGIDAACHLYWPYRYPAEYAVSDEEREDLGGVVDSCYMMADRVLGSYMDAVDSATVLVVCSDHGYGSLGEGKHFHVPDGMIAFWGRPIRAGASLPLMHEEDVAPTVLGIMGHQRARDMDGRMLSTMMVGQYRTAMRSSEVDTYERGTPAHTEPLASPIDDDVLEQLVALGYVEPPVGRRSAKAEQSRVHASP